MKKIFNFMNDEIEFFYDAWFPTKTLRGKCKCVSFWVRKVLLKGLSNLAPWTEQ